MTGDRARTDTDRLDSVLSAESGNTIRKSQLEVRAKGSVLSAHGVGLKACMAQVVMRRA